MQWWEQPAFYLALISLMGVAGNYLKSKTIHTVAAKAMTEVTKVRSHLVRTGQVPPEGLK